MHLCVYVIGDVSKERLERGIPLTPPGGWDEWWSEGGGSWPDWAGIGGRYTGSLIPVPGATSGVVYGDTLPVVDAGLAALAREAGGNMLRPRAVQRPGVDQLLVRDLDVEATATPPQLLDAEDNMHGPDLTPEEEGIYMAIAMFEGYGFQAVDEPSDADKDAVMSKMDAWQQRYRELIAAADPDALITVVDVHA